MNTIDEIRNCFAAKIEGYTPICNIDQNYPAYALINSGSFGVAVPFDNSLVVAEHFSGAQLHSRRRILAGASEQVFLELTSNNDLLRNEFATLCAQFINPGKDGADRKALVDNPLIWWRNWKMLLGNVVSEKTPYAVISEMITLYDLYRSNKNVKWAAADHVGTQDIEDEDNSYEVKSTIKKTGVQITVSSIGQLKKNTQKRLLLYFCRMEKSEQGVSINDMVHKLINEGYNDNLLEQELMKIGYEYGSSVRNEKYRLSEGRIYEIDEKFPAITEASFVGGKMPSSVVAMSYTIELSNYPYIGWDPKM